jgi:hypothetical protein
MARRGLSSLRFCRIKTATRSSTAVFSRRRITGRRSTSGRSLRDFDLTTRLFRYPLSYLIYSEAFDRLPSSLREKVFRRLYDVLSGADKRDAFASLSMERRRAALEILADTRANLPSYWTVPESGH